MNYTELYKLIDSLQDEQLVLFIEQYIKELNAHNPQKVGDAA